MVHDLPLGVGVLEGPTEPCFAVETVSAINKSEVIDGSYRTREREKRRSIDNSSSGRSYCCLYHHHSGSVEKI